MYYPLHKWLRPGDTFLECFLNIKCIYLKTKIRFSKGKEKSLKWFQRESNEASKVEDRGGDKRRRKTRRGTVKKTEKQGITNEGKCGLISLLQFVVGPDSSVEFPREQVQHPEPQTDQEGEY